METYWLNRNEDIPLDSRGNLKRKLNSLLVSYAEKSNAERVFGRPRHLIIDLINVCGLKCPICPQGRCEIPRKPSQMTEELFKIIVDALGPYLYSMTLTNWGEPLRHPKLISFIKYARKYPVYIGFSSNLQNLKPEMIDQLIHSGVDEIAASIDGVTTASYSKYRVGGDFSLAFQNLTNLINRRNALSLNRPKIRWQVLLNRYTEPEIEAIRSKAEEIGVDQLVFVPIYIDIARMFTHSPEERFDRDRDWLPENEELSWYDYQTKQLKTESKKCMKLWDTMVVHPDGAVSPCCAVIDPRDDFGKIQGAGDIMRIWNGESYRSARRLMGKHLASDTPVICSKCIKQGIVIF